MRVYLPIENVEQAFRTIEDSGLHGEDWDIENLCDAEVGYQGYRYRRMDEYEELRSLCSKSLRAVSRSSFKNKCG